MRSTGARLLLIGAMELLIAVVALGTFAENVEGFRAAARYSARLSLGLFALMLLADVAPHGRIARTLGEHRYTLFAFNHVIHFGFLATYVVLSDRFPPFVRLLGGIVGYAWIVAMPWLQTRLRAGHLNARAWRRWEVGYQLYVGFMFLMSYIPRVFGDSSRYGGERVHFILLFVFVVALGIWRVAVALLTARGILRRHDDPV